MINKFVDDCPDTRDVNLLRARRIPGARVNTGDSIKNECVSQIPVVPQNRIGQSLSGCIEGHAARYRPTLKRCYSLGWAEERVKPSPDETGTTYDKVTWWHRLLRLVSQVRHDGTCLKNVNGYVS
jgi:hypothetical protein